MITLKTKLVTPFHRTLANTAWVEAAEGFLEQRIRLASVYQTSDGGGILTSRYSEPRYMGPLSVVKFRFEVDVQVSRGKGSPQSDRYQAVIDYDPSTGVFICRQEQVSTVEGRARKAEELRRKRDLESMSFEKLVSKGEFDKKQCPKCAGPLSVQFYPEGHSWSYWCSKDSQHFNSCWRPVQLAPGEWWTDFVGDRHCPKCASPESVVGILFGLIRDTKDIDLKVWMLGGCIATQDLWYCLRCKLGFRESIPNKR